MTPGAMPGSSPLTRGKRPHALSHRLDPGLIPAHAGKTRYRRGPLAKMRAHPRSRGENGKADYDALKRWGSSPLTRGKRNQELIKATGAGLIPAHAGKTGQTSRVAASAWAHPRSRGENQPSACIRRRRGRLIPAHAGKTPPTPCPWSSGTAHPRSRGENAVRIASLVPVWGSSPLTRGKPGEGRAGGARGGLIPAHAGKTRESGDAARAHRAHPRSRGENLSRPRGWGKSPGSSPLTRGKRTPGDTNVYCRGLIPAHAGKTRAKSSTVARSRAHPRSRGENPWHSTTSYSSGGSSPLTRGKLRERVFHVVKPGLIPAHAGKTPRSSPRPPEPPAHPRSRGENRSRRERKPATTGSSPLTRGKHFLTCAFIAQIDQILESLELCAFSESYSSQDVYATDAPRDRVRSIDLGLRSSRGAS